MAIRPITGQRTPPAALQSMTDHLRVYLYQLADTGALSREQADALLAGQLAPEDLALAAGPAQFVRDCLARIDS